MLISRLCPFAHICTKMLISRHCSFTCFVLLPSFCRLLLLPISISAIFWLLPISIFKFCAHLALTVRGRGAACWCICSRLFAQAIWFDWFDVIWCWSDLIDVLVIEAWLVFDVIWLASIFIDQLQSACAFASTCFKWVAASTHLIWCWCWSDWCAGGACAWCDFVHLHFQPFLPLISCSQHILQISCSQHAPWLCVSSKH